MLRGVNDRFKTWAMGEQEDVTRGMPMLKELRLVHINTWELYAALSKIINFRDLIRLKIMSGRGGQDLLRDMDENTGDRELCLEHVVAELEDFWDEEYADLRETLRSLYRKCKSLESFHMYYQLPGWHPQDTLCFLPRG
jgi:hypothetical protein